MTENLRCHPRLANNNYKSPGMHVDTKKDSVLSSSILYTTTSLKRVLAVPNASLVPRPSRVFKRMHKKTGRPAAGYETT